jgi:Tfp pilus assembly protein PilZ
VAQAAGSTADLGVGGITDMASNSTAASRRHTRKPVQITARVSSVDAERDPATGRAYFWSAEEICSNLSEGGALVECAEPLAAGTRVLLELGLSGGLRVELIGRVAWTRIRAASSQDGCRYSIGVEFIGGSRDHFNRLSRQLRQPTVPEPRPRARAHFPTRSA